MKGTGKGVKTARCDPAAVDQRFKFVTEYDSKPWKHYDSVFSASDADDLSKRSSNWDVADSGKEL